MLPTTITIPTSYTFYNQGAGTFPDITYNKMSDNESRVIYADAARSARTGTPRTLTIAHTPAKPGPTGVDRSLVKFQTHELDEATGLTHIATCSLNIAIPRAAPFTSEFIEMMLVQWPYLLFPDWTTSPFDTQSSAVINSIQQLSL